MENEKMFDLMEKMYVEMQNGFKKVDERFNKVDERFNKVDERFSGIENDIDSLKKGQIRLENRLEDTRKTLFDGYIQNSEKIDILDEKIDKLQIDVNSLSMKTANNDTRIIELSRNLKKVK